MSEILTITLNPALDVATSVDAVVAGAKLRCGEPRYDPGGGGVNVSRAILRLEGQSEAFVAFGGETGLMALAMLKAEGIEPIHFPVAGNTRQSMAVVETSTGKQYRFQLPGPAWPPEQSAALLTALKPHLTQGRLVVMSGSVPVGAPADIGSTINKLAIENGASMILDTSGDALVSAAENTGPPFALLRMDGAEATEVSGRSFASPTELADYGLQLIARGAAEKLVMSIGSKGTVGVSAEDRFFCQPPKIETRSAVGAGDSMVAAIALKLSAGNSFRDAVRHGVAAAGSAVMTPATQLCSKETADEILERVVTAEI
ncbi:MAG: 1-phosphofructokinase family hexose kinase [Hoeflea sp.]|uniref:1-phosphofructokinase family hexose kinase n=1 Tax=Hoeflea sp. TaxID=1940281 RepID=UPI001DF9FE99|nr:1-phosphofructokinase family hexose kinase [Hoeflea sp.]MBU4530524.1 1-phosphofructokinase family hexose kinase [Alphaproteobacteria bacterium]MBU4545311.1 1-phosphofructokinase family hexose kinase [Alphaproteobacteria bacterium]MBU4548960.1 1-phosphofructokinase family hexose kinase [Alphaproteobacteria bacterium]MBV1722115.1 1-phosphofructokinase family hexose kinase [Hoeflea sp.]MBV1761465.1 1-phosphofructokinase family hexose kinase [Hoeflea sp.]